MESKRTTRAASQDVGTRRGTRKSPGRKRSPSPIVEENVSPKTKARGRPKSASRSEKTTPKSPKKSTKTTTEKAPKSPKTSPPQPKKSPRGRPAKNATTTTTASTISSTSTTKTLNLSSTVADGIKSRLRASMTPMTRSSRSMSRSVFDREFSDTEENDRPSSASFDRRSLSLQAQDRVLRFGLPGAILLVIGMISIVLGVTLSCSSTGCKPTVASLKRSLLQCSTWFDAQSAAVSVLFTAAVTLVSALPTGRVVEIPRDEDEFKTYTFNGFATCAVAVLALLFSDSQWNGIQFIHRHYFHLCILSLITAVIVAGAAFVRARYQPVDSWNAYARTTRPFCDFLLGREVSPLWFNRIDAKLVFYRISVITTLLLNVVFLAKTVVLPPTVPLNQLNATSVLGFVSGIRADVATTVAAAMVLFYCVDLLVFEHHLTSSFEIQCEGFGALVLLRYAIFPYMLSVLPKYVLENATRAPWWIVSAMTTVFAIGLVLKRCADCIKYQYRMDAENPKFENLDTIHTFQGQGIIAGSLWKIVRHPNHLGEALIYLSFLPLLCVRFAWAPLVAILYLVGVMVHRSARVDHRSSLKYNSAWAQYAKVAPNLLVPRVY